MNKTPLIVWFLLCVCTNVFSNPANVYMERFQAYQHWNQNIPRPATPEFLAFIKETTPLANKLREKWLFQLASQKDWKNYLAYYLPSPNISLQCYHSLSMYYSGEEQKALIAAKSLWLSGGSLPQACTPLLDILIKSPDFDDHLLTARISLALENHNLSLARYLLKQFKPPRLEDVDLLTDIYQNPTHILKLNPGPLHDQFYLYGLLRLVNSRIDEAVKIWKLDKTKQMLNEKEKQTFLIHLTIYKAIRNHPDTALWFAKIKSSYYNNALLDWQIRHALKHQQWSYVEFLIKHCAEQNTPAWQYWLARALEAQGKKVEAQKIYQKVAQQRNYYGFLSSLRAHQSLSFAEEKPIADMRTLIPYQPITEQIKSLYLSKQFLTASRLINDFVLELPKQDRSAFAYWLAHDLSWHSKSLLISNHEDLTNQLALRFPLAHQEAVTLNAKQYHVPKEFIFAIIRQESTFHDDIISPAGAHGLMQLMPSTAKVIANKEKISFKDKRELFLPQLNIQIGTAYLKQLAQRFKHPILISAAYNAGPTQVVYWLKNHPPKQIDIWIETLPWQETRNYLKNIFAFYVVYQFRMKQKPDLSEFMKPVN